MGLVASCVLLGHICGVSVAAPQRCAILLRPLAAALRAASQASRKIELAACKGTRQRHKKQLYGCEASSSGHEIVHLPFKSIAATSRACAPASCARAANR